MMVKPWDMEPSLCYVGNREAAFSKYGQPASKLTKLREVTREQHALARSLTARLACYKWSIAVSERKNITEKI